jgi:hypothetical protein
VAFSNPGVAVKSKYEYTLRLRTSLTVSESTIDYNAMGKDVPDTKHPKIDPIAKADERTFDMYFNSGSLRLQTFIDNIIL